MLAETGWEPSIVEWIAIVLSLASLLMGAFVLWRAGDLEKDMVETLRQARASQSRSSIPDASLSDTVRATLSRDPALGEMRERIADLEQQVSWLQSTVKAARADVSPRVVLESSAPYLPPEPRIADAPPSDQAASSVVETLPGVLSGGDEVKVTSGSRAMVEIRWSDGAPTAEVWINREYKFADITADLVTSAFDVENGGPGSYETLTPATIAWTRGAVAGRVRERGRARALGT